MRARAKHLTYANVISTLCLFLILGGGVAYAADTVFSTDIVDGEVKAVDIDDAAVQTGEIGNNEVRSVDVRNDTASGGGLASPDIAADALTGQDISEDDLFNDDSLTSKDINESDLFNDDSLTAADISNSSTIGGSEINESSLSQVPSAAKVGNQSLQLINFAASNGSGASGGGSIGGAGGLGVTFSCAVATGDLNLSLRTAVDNASLAVSDDDSYFDVEDFDVASGDVDILTPLGGDSDEIINFVYVNGSGFGIHKVITGQLHVLDEAPAGTQSECVVAGHAIFTV
jgi:hypothetical protein